MWWHKDEASARTITIPALDFWKIHRLNLLSVLSGLRCTSLLKLSLLKLSCSSKMGSALIQTPAQVVSLRTPMYCFEYFLVIQFQLPNKKYSTIISLNKTWQYHEFPMEFLEAYGRMERMHCAHLEKPPSSSAPALEKLTYEAARGDGEGGSSIIDSSSDILGSSMVEKIIFKYLDRLTHENIWTNYHLQIQKNQKIESRVKNSSTTILNFL